MLPLDDLTPQRQLAAGQLAVVVAEQRVLADRGWERAFCQAEHDNEVEVEANPHADRPNEDSLAEPTDASEIAVELERERAGEHVECYRALDRVESAESIERQLHPLSRSALLGRPACPLVRATEVACEVPIGPLDLVAPAARTLRLLLQIVDQADDEISQAAGSGRAVTG